MLRRIRQLRGWNLACPIAASWALTPVRRFRRVFYNQNLQIFQTSDHLALLTEMVHTVRVVPLDEHAPLDADIRQWSGDSRGHWEGEGDTLVVTTSNFNGRSAWDRCPVFRSLSPTESLTLVERFTRVDAETLEYAYTVTDPRTWTRPWSASLTFRRTDAPIYEYACHEGNHAIANILTGARAAEKTEKE